jgi:hypothetical protein
MATDDDDLNAELLDLLAAGQKLEAIKRYREATGVGVAEAKDAVEAIGVRRQVVAPSGSGCLGVLLFVAVGAIGLLKVLTTS